MPNPPATEADIAKIARQHGTGPAARWAGITASRVVRIRRSSGERYKRGRGHPSKEEMRKALPSRWCACRMCQDWRAEQDALRAQERAEREELRRLEAELRRLEELERTRAEEDAYLAASIAWAEMMHRVQAKAYAKPADDEAAGGWRLLAVCTEADHKLFYPNRPDRGGGQADPVELFIGGRLRGMKRYNPALYEPAKSICVLCPVREDCLAYALENNERWGVWGGLDWLERDLLAGYLPTGVREPPKPEKTIEAEPELAELAS